MKVIITTGTYRDHRESLEIVATTEEGETMELSFFDGEPEDNTLSRNFSDCSRIESIIHMAYEAGQRNEGLEVEEVEKE